MSRGHRRCRAAPQSSFADSLRTAVNKARKNPPQTKPRMSTIVITVEVVMGLIFLEMDARRKEGEKAVLND